MQTDPEGQAMITPEEFEVLKEESIKAADNTIEMAQMIADRPVIANIHIQLLGLRLLATVIASEMIYDKVTYEQASELLMKTLRKETEGLVEAHKEQVSESN